jgi:hypothetical protein
MNALIKKQYAQVKQLATRIESEIVYYKTLSDNEENHKKQSLKTQVNLMELFALLTGNADLVCDVIIGSFHIFGEIQETFKAYEEILLNENLIEFGDTLSDDEKQSYYHQQKIEQEYHTNVKYYDLF